MCAQPLHQKSTGLLGFFNKSKILQVMKCWLQFLKIYPAFISRGKIDTWQGKEKKKKKEALKHSSNNLSPLASRSVKFYRVFLK